MSTPHTSGTAGNDPDQIRAEIDRTQAHLSTDVNAVTEKVTPGRIVGRRVDRARHAAGRLKDRVMGSNDDTSATYRNPYAEDPGAQTQGVTQTVRAGAGSATSGVSDAASSAAATVSGVGSTVSDAVQDAPRAARRGTQGNPLAAGLIAFGAGWLVSSLLPASRREQQLAEQARDRAGEYGQPLADKAKQVAAEVRDNLEEPARQAVETVRSSASDAGRTVADEGRSAAQDVQHSTRDATGTVRSNASS